MMANGAMKVEVDVQFERGRRGRKRATIGGSRPDAAPPSRGRLPRVTKLMALAIRFERLVQTGEVASYAELARLGHVTRARMTQIMAFLHLAPDIQDALLNLRPVERGRDPITERDIRPILAQVAWGRQRRGWHNLWYASQMNAGEASSRSGPASDNT
ncbi:MAG: hypothetical protein KJZ69_09345 [Phycisphaerales bacterium]|nr:hypothetical protein [Phycisphaerales bacterium]